MRRVRDKMGNINLRISRKRTSLPRRNHEPPVEDCTIELSEAVADDLKKALDRMPNVDLLVAYYECTNKLDKAYDPQLAKRARAVIDNELLHRLSICSARGEGAGKGFVKMILVSIAAQLARDGMEMLSKVIQSLFDNGA